MGHYFSFQSQALRRESVFKNLEEELKLVNYLILTENIEQPRLHPTVQDVTAPDIWTQQAKAVLKTAMLNNSLTLLSYSSRILKTILCLNVRLELKC